MGHGTLSSDAYLRVQRRVTAGGTRSATHDAEVRFRKEKVLDPMVDPRGPAHLGPVRRSLPRFIPQGNLWVLTKGIPMALEDLLDTTGSMGDNVNLALDSLLHRYMILTSGTRPLLGRYDVQIATANFNDEEDYTDDRFGEGGVPILCRSQFEMAEKIAEQQALLYPGRNGHGNRKEDPQFGLFAAAYLTDAVINRYGLKSYHFTISDEPTVEYIDYEWLKKIFGDDILDRLAENGFNFTAGKLPKTAQVVRDLQTRAHAFFLQVNGRSDVSAQWTKLYGAKHVVHLTWGTEYLHCVEACIIGLTEGVLDLGSSVEFLRENEVPHDMARRIVDAVSHIPLEEQRKYPNFGLLPKAGDVFRQKTDLWPVPPEELADLGDAEKRMAGNEKDSGWI
jgi:hypothetical protein